VAACVVRHSALKAARFRSQPARLAARRGRRVRSSLSRARALRISAATSRTRTSAKRPHDASPLLVLELRVDTVGEVELSFDRRIRQKVVCANLDPREILGEAGDRLGRILRHDELPTWSEPVEPSSRPAAPHSVRGHAIDPRAGRAYGSALRPCAQCRVVGGRIPRVAAGGKRKGS
jgi:hypothetical protein